MECLDSPVSFSFTWEIMVTDRKNYLTSSHCQVSCIHLGNSVLLKWYSHFYLQIKWSTRQRNIHSRDSWNWDDWWDFWFPSWYVSSRDHSSKIMTIWGTYITGNTFFCARIPHFCKSSLWERQELREKHWSCVSEEKMFSRWRWLVGFCE